MKRGLSPIRSLIELILLTIGLIAGIGLAAILITVPEDMKYVKDLLYFPPDINSNSAFFLLLGAVFLILTLRFFIVLTKSKKNAY